MFKSVQHMANHEDKLPSAKVLVSTEPRQILQNSHLCCHARPERGRGRGRERERKRERMNSVRNNLATEREREIYTLWRSEK